MQKSKKSKLISLLLTIVTIIGIIPFSLLQVSASTQADKLISTAESQIGYKEGSDGYTKYGAWYGIPRGHWCAMFVSWCANQSSISTSTIPKHASCDVGKDWFKNKGLWENSKYKGGSYTPKKGDIIYFSSTSNMNDSTHVGIVTSASSTTVYTIEGNTSDQVARKSYSLGYKTILGYGIPTYTTVVDSNVYFPKYTGTSSSLVDGLKAVGATYTFEYRKTIAAKNGISSYTGTASQNTTLLNLLKQGKLIKPSGVVVPPVTQNVFPKYTGTSSSLVDGLKAVGATYTFEYRKTIATKNGVSSYTGTASQNTTLLNLLKQGKLIKP